MLPVLPLLVGGALGTVVGFSLKKYFDENQSDIFERIENDTKNLIDRMDFSKLDALKQSVYNGTFISFAQYFNSLNQNELEKFDIKNVEECSTIGVSTPILVYEDNQNQIKIDKITDFLDELNSNLISIFYVLQKDTHIDFKNFSQERQALIKEAYNIAKQGAAHCDGAACQQSRLLPYGGDRLVAPTARGGAGGRGLPDQCACRIGLLRKRACGGGGA